MLATTVAPDNRRTSNWSARRPRQVIQPVMPTRIHRRAPAIQPAVPVINRKYRTFQLKGDSMLPIPDKAWVTGEFLQDWHDFRSGQAYIILTSNDGIVFKVVENNIEKSGRLVLFSLNPLYEPYEVHINDVRELWKFVHYISDELPEPVLPEKQLLRTVASMKQDLYQLKKSMGRDIEDAKEL